MANQIPAGYLDARDFYIWAQEQAKRHGAKSEISEWSSVSSPYIIKDFNTWGDVLAAAQSQFEPYKQYTAQDPKYASLEAQALGQNNTGSTGSTGSAQAIDPNQLPQTLRQLQNQLLQAKGNVDNAQLEMNNSTPGSPAYNKAKSDFDAAVAQRDSLQAQIQADQTSAQNAATAKQAQADEATANQRVKDLQNQRQRAQDQGLPTAGIDAEIAAERAKAAAAQKAIQANTPAPAPTGPSGATGAPTGPSGAAIKPSGPSGAAVKPTGPSGAVGKPPVATGGTAPTGAGNKPAATGGSAGGTGGGTAGGGTSGTYSGNRMPSGAAGINGAGQWVDANGKVLGTLQSSNISQAPKGAVAITNGNWVDAQGKILGSAAVVDGANANAYQQFVKQYGSEAAIINSDPTLKKMFTDAINAPGAALSTADFQALYENSNYYKNSYSSYLQAEQARLADPGSYAQQYNQALQDIKNYAAQAGISLDPNALGQPLELNPANTTNPLATHAFNGNTPNLVDDILHKYWDTGSGNQQAITQYLATKGTIDPTIMGGQAQTDTQTIKGWMQDYGLSNLGDTYVNNYVKQIEEGGLAGGTPIDLNYVKQDLINKATALYPTMAKQLQAGQTVTGEAGQYISALQNTLELTPDQIDLSDPNPTSYGAMVRNAAQTGMSIDAFTKQAMNNPRWNQTQGAKQGLSSFGTSLLNAFGVNPLG